MIRNLTCASAIGLVFLASAATADVTAKEVWDSWQAMATSAGQELTVGDVADNGATVQVSDLVIAYKDQLGGSASVTFDKLTFADNGDGTVTVTMPESYPLQMAFPPKEDGPGSLKLTVSQPGMKIIAGGSATETSYDFTAPMVTIKLDEVTDETGKVLDTKADLTMTDAAAKYLVARDGDKTTLDSSFTTKALGLNISGTDSVENGGTGGGGTVNMTMADLSGTTKGNFLTADAMANMAAALSQGFTMDTGVSFGAMALDADITDPTGPTKLVANATGGGFQLAINKDRMTYGSSLTGAKFTISGAEIPFPQVELAFAESGFNLMMPVTKSDSPQDFAFLTKVVDFTVSDDVWGLFDPAGRLSREPATVIVDLKGTGFWTQDIMDPAVQEAAVGSPGQLDSLDLTQVLAKAAGAEVSATGGLTFDNTGVSPDNPMPKPTGKINVDIKGANKLVENLIALGILSEDDAMGFRMMLAMFARPGAGPDELTSEVEFKGTSVFANGQQIQ
jgi:Uncharacterized protein conserved in bacteria (DUF2125)